MYLLSFYVPETHLELVKQAVFEAGAGTMGSYKFCAWQTKGQGQFMPLDQSNPYLGQLHCLEKVSEYKVEVICSAERITAVTAALKVSHPYETPAYHLIQMAYEN